MRWPRFSYRVCVGADGLQIKLDVAAWILSPCVAMRFRISKE